MLKHKGTVTIETERLILRRFVPSDIEQIFYNCWSNYEVWKWTNYAPMNCIEDVRKSANMFTDNWLNAYERLNRYSWAIEIKSTNEVTGRFFGMHPNDHVGQVELAYEIGQKWWNQGYMTEAASTIVDFFFTEVGFNRIHAYHAGENKASGRVMQKIGMTYEATLRRGGKCNAGIIDKVCYSILADEYKNRK